MLQVRVKYKKVVNYMNAPQTTNLFNTFDGTFEVYNGGGIDINNGINCPLQHLPQLIRLLSVCLTLDAGQ